MSGDNADPNSVRDDSPRRAAVVPRGGVEGSSSSLPLEALIAPYLERECRGLICIAAPPGGGKTVALRHLHAVLPARPWVLFFDAHEMERASIAAQTDLAIIVAEDDAFDPRIDVLAKFILGPWTLDDCLEYLVARHRDQVASVLNRLVDDEAVDALAGLPQLLTLVMDRMATDPALQTARETLWRFVADLIPSQIDRNYWIVGIWYRLGIKNADLPALTDGEPRDIEKQTRWCRHDSVRRALLGEWIGEALGRNEIPACLHGMACKSALGEISDAVAQRPKAIERLEGLIAQSPGDVAVPMAASVLLRVRPDWRLESKRPINLVGAVLCSARWANVELKKAKLRGADFSDADLRCADLSGVDAEHAQMTRANLHDANLDQARLAHASFAGADLSRATLEEANLVSTDFEGADLSAANLSAAEVFKTNLHGAILRGVLARAATFHGVEIEDADFTDADLTGAKFSHVQMSGSKWDRSVFRNAWLLKCNFEGVRIEAADFAGADLSGSLFTGSVIPGGKFGAANLSEAGLAEVEWGGADLRGADFTHASFHLGSSRSGLVGSTIPSEGSRTGFYTDDYNEQDYKSPEEIRKASLCNADLRGAKVEGTDFYLVDLRGAKYSRTQGQHFARCGAILVSRVP